MVIDIYEMYEDTGQDNYVLIGYSAFGEHYDKKYFHDACVDFVLERSALLDSNPPYDALSCIIKLLFPIETVLYSTLESGQKYTFLPRTTFVKNLKHKYEVEIFQQQRKVVLRENK